MKSAIIHVCVRLMGGCVGIAVIAWHMRWGRQEDAHEFLRYMVEAMHTSCVNGHQTYVNFTYYRALTVY